MAMSPFELRKNYELAILYSDVRRMNCGVDIGF